MSGNPRIIREGGYQVLPPLPDKQRAALKADIAARGILTPIDVDEFGIILDGHNREDIAKELGIVDIPTIVRLGLTDVEKRSFARRSNALRRHLTRKQLRELVADQLRETPERANNWIANDLGVDGKTVASIRARLERTSEIPKLTKFVGADGKERGARTPSIMVPGLAELRDVLAKAETMPPDQAAGFIAAHNPSGRVYRVEINPFADRSEEAIREWHLFVLYLIRKCGWEGDGAIMHLEWLLDRFHAVSDALSAQFRRSCGLSPLPESTIIGWERFAAEHRDQPKDEIVRMVNAARSEVSQNNNSRRIQRRPRRTGAI